MTARQPRLPGTPAVLETEHWAAIAVAVSAAGGIVRRQAVGLAVPVGGKHPVKFGTEGQGDLNVCWNGWNVEIETKLPRGRHLETQKRFRAAWERAGGVYLLVRERTPAEAAATAVAALQALPERAVERDCPLGGQCAVPERCREPDDCVRRLQVPPC